MSDIVDALNGLTANIGRDHRSGREYVIGDSQVVVDALRNAADEITRLRRELAEARDKALEQAAYVAENEPELVGAPSDHVITAMINIGPVENARAACRTTKKSIAAAIRSLKEKAE